MIQQDNNMYYQAIDIDAKNAENRPTSINAQQPNYQYPSADSEQNVNQQLLAINQQQMPLGNPNQLNQIISYQKNELLCYHESISVTTETLQCETCLCVFCSFFAVFGTILALLVSAQFCKDSNGHHHHHGNTDFDCVVCYCCLMNEDQRASLGYDKHDACACDTPRVERTICNVCGKVLMEKSHTNNLNTSIMFGAIGIILLTVSLVLILFMPQNN